MEVVLGSSDKTWTRRSYFKGRSPFMPNRRPLITSHKDLAFLLHRPLFKRRRWPMRLPGLELL